MQFTHHNNDIITIPQVHGLISVCYAFGYSTMGTFVRRHLDLDTYDDFYMLT